MQSNKLVIGFITYGESTAKYLPYFLESLKKQSFKDFKILAIDNTEVENNENKKYIKENFPEIYFKWAGKNLGFAKAFNKMISEAIEMKAEYFLCLNPDIILEPNAISELLKVIILDNNIGAVQPKILKWDFDPVKSQDINLGSQSEFNGASNEKTNIIDSLGLVMKKNFRFYDDRQGESEINSGDKTREIFGFTGAAVMLRIKALEDVAYYSPTPSNSPPPIRRASLARGGEEQKKGKGEFFDELMFMYKEDCDLSLRMRLAGWRIMLASDAVIYHDRTAAITGRKFKDIFKSRFHKSRQVKKWSFLNQWIIILKYNKLFSGQVEIATWRYQIKSMIFVIIFEQYLIKEFFKALKLLSEIKEKRDQLKIRISVRDIEKMME